MIISVYLVRTLTVFDYSVLPVATVIAHSNDNFSVYVHMGLSSIGNELVDGAAQTFSGQVLEGANKDNVGDSPIPGGALIVFDFSRVMVATALTITYVRAKRGFHRHLLGKLRVYIQDRFSIM